MKMSKGVVCVCAALALQVVAVGFLVWRYERIVQKGTEVRIKCQAYDPYDPLRGRYLRVTVSETCTNILFEVDVDNYWKVPEGDIYAKLAKAPGDDGLYRVEAVAREPTDAGLWVKTKSLRLTHAHDHESKRTGESYDEFYARQRKSRTKQRIFSGRRLPRLSRFSACLTVRSSSPTSRSAASLSSRP